MMKSISLVYTDLDRFQFAVPQDARYIQFDHGKQEVRFHVFFLLGEVEFRFSIAPAREPGAPEELASRAYALNAPLSLREWCTPPYPLESSQTNGWACGYGLLEGQGLKIFKVYYDAQGRSVCLTFSASPENYRIGFPVFDQIARSFIVVNDDLKSDPLG